MGEDGRASGRACGYDDDTVSGNVQRREMTGGITMTCETVEELAGAYALDALPEDELDALNAHIGVCPRTHLSLQQLAETAELLALISEESLPPPSLRQRILDAATADLEVPIPAPVLLHQRSAHRQNGTRTAGFRFSRMIWLPAAAALAALALGLGIWGAGERAQLSQRTTALHSNQTVLTALAAGATVVQLPGSGARQPALLVQPRGGGAAYLVADAPQLPDGKVYEAWYINGPNVALAASFAGSASGPQVIQLSGPLTNARAVAVTIEPKGSTTPTGPKILERTLS